MLIVDKLKVEFHATPLFEEVSFVIDKKDRVALVGKNGAGKSTLLKILAGLQAPTSGSVSRSADFTVGYLPQVMKLTDSRTLVQEAETAFAELFELQDKVTRYTEELSARTDYESDAYQKLIDRLTQAQERFDTLGGHNYRAAVEKTLLGLGFVRGDFDRPTGEFSGGWRMRIELAKILLRKPELLLLDEPTNHLDIESIQWLENFLRTEAKAVVVVSHDKTFLNNVTNRTMEISCGHLYDYKVTYDNFVKLRQERREQQLRAYRNQQKLIADTRAFIERFRYQATKAVQVQSRIKQLEKIVPIQIDEIDTATLRLHFTCPCRSGSYPVICDDVGKAFGSHVVFSHVNMTINRGEKVAFVGRNGEGKTTLVRCLMGQLADYTGTITIGHNVKIGYFAQNQAQLLDDDLTIFDTIDRVAVGDIRTRIRDLLGAFMFGGEAADKKVKVLSGGERARLAMLKMLLEPANLLILDEPTNHLDIPSKEVLKNALLSFEGTAIVVSHDRDFLDGLVDKVYEFGGGVVREHIGGIYDFLAKKRQQLDMLDDPASLDAVFKNVKKTEEKAENLSDFHTFAPNEAAQPLSYAEQKEQSRRLRKLERQVADLEEQVRLLEDKMHTLEAQLSAPDADPALFEQYGQARKQLDGVMAEWEARAMELEEIKPK